MYYREAIESCMFFLINSLYTFSLYLPYMCTATSTHYFLQKILLIFVNLTIQIPVYIYLFKATFKVSYTKKSKLHFCVYSFSYTAISCRFKTANLVILQKRSIIDICWDCRLVPLVLLSNLQF